MKELRDYSGEFAPDIRFQDFSKDTLAELLRVYSQVIQATDGLWYLAIKERRGDEDAFACDLWAAPRVVGIMVEEVAKLLKIQGKDIPAVMKYLQVAPWLGTYQYKVELKKANQGILITNHCPTLAALEREGEGREKNICQMVCGGLIYRKIADFFNPDIEVNALKLPPREGEEETCCEWEFKLEGN